MNLNGNEKLIAQLFVEMSREDAERAPQFASVLSSTRVPRRERNWSIAFAAALAMLIMAVVDRAAYCPSHIEARRNTAAGHSRRMFHRRRRKLQRSVPRNRQSQKPPLRSRSLSSGIAGIADHQISWRFSWLLSRSHFPNGNHLLRRC